MKKKKTGLPWDLALHHVLVRGIDLRLLSIL